MYRHLSLSLQRYIHLTSSFSAIGRISISSSIAELHSAFLRLQLFTLVISLREEILNSYRFSLGLFTSVGTVRGQRRGRVVFVPVISLFCFDILKTFSFFPAFSLGHLAAWLRYYFSPKQ